MITLQLNGEEAALPDDATVRDAVATLTRRDVDGEGRAADGRSLGVAVAVDAVVVPRSRWSATPLGAGQVVEIVTAVQGG